MSRRIPVKQYYASHQGRDQKGGDRAPPVPHLAVRRDATSIVPIEPGVHMFIVNDPSKINGVFELIFEKIKFVNDRPTEIHFIVPQDGGSRKCIFNVAWHGDYKAWTAANPEATEPDTAVDDAGREAAKAALAAWKAKHGG